METAGLVRKSSRGESRPGSGDDPREQEVTDALAARRIAVVGWCAARDDRRISLLHRGDQRAGRRIPPHRGVLYFRDFDLQGHQIEANTRRVLEHKARRRINWNRIAITEEQIAQRGHVDLEEGPPVYDRAWGSAGIRSMGSARPSSRAPSNASSGMPWTACCPNRSATFWSVRRSSGCGSLSFSTASTSELRYEHGRDSEPGEPRADDRRGTDAGAPRPAAWRRRTQSEAGTEARQTTDVARSVAGGTYR